MFDTSKSNQKVLQYMTPQSKENTLYRLCPCPPSRDGVAVSAETAPQHHHGGGRRNSILTSQFQLPCGGWADGRTAAREEVNQLL
jgi:hypothetical protein